MNKRLIQFDWAIKHILRDKAHFAILEGLLSELLCTEVKINSLLESESNKELVEDKFNRVDVLAELKGGEKVIIEVQFNHQCNLLSRMANVSKAIFEYVEAEQLYKNIPRIIAVTIDYSDSNNSEDYIYHGTTQFNGLHQQDTLQLDKKEKEYFLNNTISKIFPDEYYVLKVSQFDLKIRDTLDEWMYALKESAVKPEFTAQGIQQAANELNILRLSKEERLEYERHVGDVQNAQRTLESNYSEGKTKVRTEGKAEGLAESEAKSKIEERK